MKNKKALLIIFVSGLFLLLDQFLKWQATHGWATAKLISPYFGWQLFLNPGVAFGLPLSNTLTIIITLPMVGLIAYLFYSALGGSVSPEASGKDSFKPKLLLAWSILLFGAVSNLMDRIIYHQVVDYFLIGTALINISDLLIITGLVLYLWNVSCHSERSE